MILHAVLVVVCVVSTQYQESHKAYAVLGDCATSRCYFLPNVFLYAPSPVRIKNFGYGGNRGGILEVFGDLENVGQSPIFSISIRVRAFDISNTLLITDTFSPVFSATLANQENPIFNNLGISADRVFSVETSIVGFSMLGDATYISQTVSFSPSLEAQGTVGEIFNSQPVTISNIVVAFNSLCSLLRQEIVGPIKPGGHITFTRVGCAYDSIAPPTFIGAQAKLSS
ncbi:MAG: hypothetical protein HC853_13340 [Anaerolineae bacterium]|nr:hypothetical protein [Anaerolineae bacterium]